MLCGRRTLVLSGGEAVASLEQVLDFTERCGVSSRAKLESGERTFLDRLEIYS
jgi:hypothetical protein